MTHLHIRPGRKLRVIEEITDDGLSDVRLPVGSIVTFESYRKDRYGNTDIYIKESAMSWRCDRFEVVA